MTREVQVWPAQHNHGSSWSQYPFVPEHEPHKETPVLRGEHLPAPFPQHCESVEHCVPIDPHWPGVTVGGVVGVGVVFGGAAQVPLEQANPLGQGLLLEQVGMQYIPWVSLRPSIDDHA